MDARHIERLVELEIGQNSRQSTREQRLAGTGRADQQQIVASGCGHLERTPSVLLAVNVGQVGIGVSSFGRRRFGNAQ